METFENVGMVFGMMSFAFAITTAGLVEDINSSLKENDTDRDLSKG